MADPRFYAYSVPQWELLDSDLPLNDVVITRALSTPKALDATLDRQYEHLVDDEGESRIREWGTAIVADHGHQIDVFLVDGVSPENEQETLAITAGGVLSYAAGQPWLVANDRVHQALRALHAATPQHTLKSGAAAGGIGYVEKTRSISGVEVDPLALVRAICVMLTTPTTADIRMTVDDTRTPESAWIGEEEYDREFEAQGEEVAFTAGPHTITWYGTDDVGREIDSLAEATPFEWREVSRWDGDLPTTHIEIGYPRIDSARKDHLFFEVGSSNVVDVTPPAWSEYANVVLVMGQGEGSDRSRSHMSNPTDRLRRVKVETDTALGSTHRAQERARRILKDLDHRSLIESITVIDGDAAPFGSFDIGDTITVRGSTPWAELGQDYRIVSITHDLTEDTQQLGLEEVRDA